MGSPEAFALSRAGPDEVDNGGSSCGSAGGGRQHGVHPAFEALDTAASRGNGGGGEAASGRAGSANGGGLNGFVGSGPSDSVRNGGVEAEAQHMGCSLATSAFFGEDLPVSL